MIRALRQLAARSRLHKARQAYAVALAEHEAACARRDSRRIHAATSALQAANRAVLTAERDALPAPAPLSRSSNAAAAGPLTTQPRHH